MVRLVSLILAAALLQACATHSTPPEPRAAVPIPPPLTAEQAAPCPPADQITDLTIDALVRADAQLASQYAKCGAGKQAVVDVYNRTRQSLIDFAASMGNEQLAERPK